MHYQITFKVSESIYLRDPESTELGRQIVKSAIDLIYKLGFEQFTFKKLAAEIHTTEATIYRYFENKHRLLLYILNWYWSYMEFLVEFKLQNIHQNKDKLSAIIDLFTGDLPESSGQFDYNKKYLNQIIIAESSKVYLVKEVTEINKSQAFKPYKDLCSKIAAVITAYNPKYKYPRSLSSTLIETAHYQQFFTAHLPKLTDAQAKQKETFTGVFLRDLMFKALD
jgi:AcrR family transcriptional regulator